MGAAWWSSTAREGKREERKPSNTSQLQTQLQTQIQIQMQIQKQEREETLKCATIININTNANSVKGLTTATSPKPFRFL